MLINKNNQDSPPDAFPKLELRIPISPRAQDMQMVRYLMESLREYGGPISREARCVVSVGADEEPRDLKREYPWTAEYPIDFHWVDRTDFRRWSYDATGFDRFEIESDADVVAIVDADMIIAGDFDDAVLESYRSKSCLGVIAHTSPFGYPHLARPGRSRFRRFIARVMGNGHITDIPSQSWWNRIFDEAGLPSPDLEWQHTGWGLDWNNIYPNSKISMDPSHRHCPAYFNYGFVIAPRAAVEAMRETFETDLEIVTRVVDNVFRSQIANTLTLARHEIPCGVLPINYNFTLNVPGDEFRALNPDPNGEDDYEDVKVFHYIGGRKHFKSRESVEALLARRDLDGGWPVFQRKLRHIHAKSSDIANI